MAGSPALIVRVAANIDELRKNLADGTSTINTTTAAMGKLASSFSGDRLIQNAQNVVAAVNQIGGATKLTGAEQARVNLTLDKALEKYRLLGREAPQAMRDLHAATTKIPPATDSIMSKLGPLAGAFGIAFSAAAVVRFGQALLDDADAMVKLSDKTGIAIEPMQRLKFIAEQSGNSFEQVAAAISKMQQNIAGGNKDAVGALNQLGISLSTFTAMTPDRQFLAIATEVAKIEDPMQRVKVATELFGKAGADLLPTLIANVKELGDAAPVMSDKAVKAFDAVGDAISSTWTKSKTLAGEGIGSVIGAFALLGTAGRALAEGDLNAAWLALNDLETELPKVVAPANDLADAAARVGMSWNDATAAGIALTRIVEGQIANKAQLAKLEKEWETAEKDRLRIEAAALLTTTKLWNEYYALRVEHGGTANEQAIAQIKRWEADTIAAAIKAGTATDAFYAALEATSKEKMDAVGIDFKSFEGKSIEALQELAANARKTYDEMLFGGLHFSRAVLDEQRDKVRELEMDARGMGAAYRKAFEDAEAAAADLLAVQQELRAEERRRQLESRSIGGSFDVTSQNFDQTLQGLITSGGWNPSDRGSNIDANRAHQLARQGYSMQEIMDIFSRPSTGPIPPPQGPRIPGFAGGVENFSGGMAIVGERGPEIVNLPRGTDVIPAGRSGGAGGGLTVNFYVTHPLGTPSAIWAAVEPGLMKTLRESGMGF